MNVISNLGSLRFDAAFLIAVFATTAFCFGASNSANAEERVEYTSSNVDFFRDLFAGKINNDTVTLSGKLYLPEGEGPFPVVIYQHGSGQPDHQNYEAWRVSLRDRLAVEGIGFFIADSFTARGINETSRNQGKLSRASRVIDALKALEALGRHPRVDGARIGIAGTSAGGIVAFGTSHEPYVNSVLPGGPRFKAHVPIYPACGTQYEKYEPTGAPLLFLIGGADNYTPAAPCLTLITSMKLNGADVEHIVYPDAHHGFVSSKPVYFNKDAWTAKDCPLAKQGVDGEETSPIGSSKGVTWTEYVNRAAKTGCATRGVNIGRNDAAAKDALEQTVNFFVQKLN